MISVSKGYEIKTKKEATGAMTTAKNDEFFYIGLNWILVGRGGKNKFLVGGGGLPPSLQLGKPCIYVYIYYTHTYYTYKYIKKFCQQVVIYNEEVPCTSHTSCTKVATLLLQDLSTLCVTDIYGIYFHLLFQCS